jgi:leucyl aminopeptidase
MPRPKSVHRNLAPTSESASARPLWCVASAGDLPEAARSWATATGFEPAAGRHLVVPDGQGGLLGVVVGMPADGKRLDPFFAGRLPSLLPEGAWRLEGEVADPRVATLGWLLGTYAFTRYKAGKPPTAKLVVPEGVDAAEVARIADAVDAGRDLVNTPANDLGPAELEEAIRTLGARYGASVSSVVGEALLERNFPMIHAVGRASPRAPRIVDLAWGDPAAPKVTLVGKGVCFDTGGLDIKPSAGMLLMKKDMGGAAAAMAAARMIMDSGLPVRLRLLVPAVENAISGSSFRPRDVLASRKGLTVEIGNTDAEGRLILADALTLAEEEEPEILIDFATLTGAARVALGPDLPPLYSDDEALAADLLAAGAAENDPLWRMPLWSPYDAMLDSKVADLDNVSSGGMAGSVTAALFLRRFVAPGRAWAHLDIYGWTPNAKPGRPEGGEVQAARAVYAMLTRRYRA